MHTNDLTLGETPVVLSEYQVVMVIELLCCRADEVRKHFAHHMKEAKITQTVRRSVLRVKQRRRLAGVQILGEVELDDTSTPQGRIQGRLDLMIQFSTQFGDEGDEGEYLAVECKLVAAGNATLNRLYVRKGGKRFVIGKYSKGHKWAIMLGYVLVLPVDEVEDDIDRRLAKAYGPDAGLRVAVAQPPTALGVYEGNLEQDPSNNIRSKHVFVDMVQAS